MFIYKATKAQFLSDVENGCFIDKLSKLYEEKIGDLATHLERQIKLLKGLEEE